MLLRECVDFFAPHLSAAKLTGEVRKDLDAEAAGEWFARIFSRCSALRRRRWTMDDPDVVARFVAEHVVRGFASDRPRPRRAADVK